MAVNLISLESPVRRALAAAGGFALVVGCVYAVVWGFANTIARNGGDREFTEFAIDISPNDPQARFANAYQIEKTFDLGDIERSLKEYEAAVALSPNNFLYWLALGQARERDGDRTGAEAAFREALKLAPNYARARWALGNNLVRQGKTEEGFEFIRGAIEQDSSFAAPAVGAASIAFGDDIERIASALDRNAFAIAELAKRFAVEKRIDEAWGTWQRIPADQRRSVVAETGKILVSKFFEERRFRAAVSVAQDIAADAGKAPRVGELASGGFEQGVVLQNADAFDWQIGPGIYPQIALTDRNAAEGKFALAILFSSPTDLNFRNVSKTVAVDPGQRYEFRFRYRNDVNTRATFRWEVVSAADGRVLAVTQPLATSPNWSAAGTVFAVPAGADGVLFRLARENCVSPQCTVGGNLFFDDFGVVSVE